MVEFIKVNKNPKGRRTGDCSTRALANILHITYNMALDEQCNMAKKYCYGITDKQTIDKIMQRYGWVKQKQPRKLDNTKYQVKEMDLVLSTDEMEDGALVLIAHHWTVVRDYYIQDIWDCGRKTVGNYWIKKDKEI